MPTDYLGLRQKYPKWAHRKDEHKKRRRKSRRKSRRKRRRQSRAKARDDSNDVMLTSLLHQLMGNHMFTLAKKHGENVITGHGGAVRPGRLAPVWSAHERNYILSGGNPNRGGGGGAGAGAAAAIGGAPAPLVPGPATMAIRPPGMGLTRQPNPLDFVNETSDRLQILKAARRGKPFRNLLELLVNLFLKRLALFGAFGLW